MSVFQQAYSSVQNVEGVVASRIAETSAISADLQDRALSVITQLSGVNFDYAANAPPSPPNVNSYVNIDYTLPDILPNTFGAITSELPEFFLDTSITITDPTFPEFRPSLTSLNIPSPPALSPLGPAPVRPDTGTVDIPTAPSVALPAVPVLNELTVPTFDGLTLPTFDAEIPEFAGSALPGILQWTEPTYQTEILDEVVVQLQNLWAGGSGIPAAVEQAMRERAEGREDLITAREVAQVAEEFSRRGFTMPSGVQAARVDQLREDLAVRKLGLNRELTIEFAKFQIENVRFAITQGIAAENVYVNLFLNMAERLFRAAQFRVQSQVEIYNAQVSLYNARINGYQIESQVFSARVQAELANVEIFRAEVEAELAKGQVNEQKVRTYAAQVEALQTYIDIYRARMQGAQVQADVIRSQIEGYRADVQAYAETVNADKVKFDAYRAQVDAEASKAGVLDAEARAYAALIQGKVSIADLQLRRGQLQISQNEVQLRAHSLDIEAEKTRIQAQLGTIQTAAQAFIADTQRFSAQAAAEGSKAQLEIAAKEVELRTNISFYQANIQNYIGHLEQLIRQSQVSVDALKAAGQIASTLAAGAQAAVHVGATLSGGGGVNASGSYSDSNVTSTSTSTSTNTNINYEGT